MTVNIDQAWLDARTPPYRLNASGEYYSLSVDVTTNGCAFFVGASNVTLDLNGHIITYNNYSPISISNNSFEDTDLSAWDLTNAPSFSRQAAPRGMVGSWCLKGTTNGNEYIISPTIAVPYLNREYCAYAMGYCDTYGHGLKLEILKASDLSVLGTTDQGTTGDQNRGFSILRRYVPTALDDIKLRITCYGNSVLCTFYVDYINLFYSRDPGIFCSKLDFESYSSYYSNSDIGVGQGGPAQLVRLSFWGAEQGKGEGFKLTDSTKVGTTPGTGQVIQGSAGGIACYPLWCDNEGPITVDGVRLKSIGVDSSPIRASYCTNPIIQNSNLEADIPAFTRRMNNIGLIHMSNAIGTASITDNQILGAPQSGITLTGLTGTSGRSYISRNTITQKATVSNCYAVILRSDKNVEINNNTITVTSGYSGRGILIDTDGGGNLEDLYIYSNTITAREKYNLEYQSGIFGPTALRIRATSTESVKNAQIYDNTFSSYTGSGASDGSQAIGCRISIENTGLSDGCNIVLTNNTYKGIAEAAAFKARGLVIDEMGGSTGVEFRGGIAESNETALAFGSNDGPNVTNQRYRIYSLTLTKSAEYTGIFTFRSYAMGSQCGSGSTRPVEVFLLDMKYSGGATNDFAWETSYWGAGDTGSILTGWVYNVVGVLADADITVVDKDVVTWYTGVAGSDGCNAYVPALVNKKVKPKTGDEVVTVLTPLTVNYDVQSKTGLIPTANETLDFSEGESQVVLMLMS